MLQGRIDETNLEAHECGIQAGCLAHNVSIIEGGFENIHIQQWRINQSVCFVLGGFQCLRLVKAVNIGLIMDSVVGFHQFTSMNQTGGLTGVGAFLMLQVTIGAVNLNWI